MTMGTKTNQPLDVSDQDILEAMRDIPGYLDITPGDFKELYLKAYQHALTRLTSTRLAGDVMTREVASVHGNTPVQEAAQVMAARGVSGLPVLDGSDRVAGVISEKDFLALMGAGQTKSFMAVVAECLMARGCVAASLRGRHAEDIMSAPAITVGPETSVRDIAALFTTRGINRAPVVDETGRLLGIVSRADLLRAGLAGN
jgi:CBS domain-containing protein